MVKYIDIRADTQGENNNSNIGTISLSEINRYFNNSYESNGSTLGEVTYFVCIKILSESLGKLNNKVYQRTDNGIVVVKHPLNDLVGLRPNAYMCASIYNATVEYYRNHYGNAFVYIERTTRKDGTVVTKGLHPLNPEFVSILIDNRGLLGTKDAVYIRYTEPRSGNISIIHYEDVLHYRSSLISSDGFSGMAIKDVLHYTLSSKRDADKLSRNVYVNGITGKAVLEYTGDLNDKAEARLVEVFKKRATGVNNYGSYIPLPLGTSLKPLNINLADIQFLDIKKYSALEIASAFGIKPNHLNNYDKSSYSNSESQNLSFYVDTLLFILNAYEQEDSYKLLSSKEREQGYFLKRNVKGILRADFKSQMQSLVQAVNTGIMQVNEARRELDLTKVTGGDANIVNGTYINIADVGKQYGVGGE